MAKYYITCGKYQYLTTADDQRSAALWAVHQFLSSRIEIDTVNWTDPQTIDRHDIIEAMLELSEKISISEIGFDRDDAGVIDSADILTEWNQLVIALKRLESLIDLAG